MHAAEQLVRRACNQRPEHADTDHAAGLTRRIQRASGDARPLLLDIGQDRCRHRWHSQGHTDAGH
jgi:hypothetical protein